MQVKAVATALGIHPFMLSELRTDVRDWTLSGRLPETTPAGPKREIVRLQQLEREHALLQEEHDLQRESHPALHLAKADAFAFIHAARATCGVARL